MSDKVNNKLYKKYEDAKDILENIIDYIYQSYEKKDIVNPIEHRKSRLKKLNSIEEKLNKKGLEFTEQNIDEHLHDVLGIRIVCCFLNDVNTIIDIINSLESKDGIRIIKRKNYIGSPKENSGYSSYHFLVEIPVYCYGEGKKYVKAEIQVRTIAMDMAASLEHKLCYKKEWCPNNLREAIKNATDFCNYIDVDLNNVAIKINDNNKKVPNITYPFMEDVEYSLFKYNYEEALKIVNMKLNNLKSYYDTNEVENPIEHIKCRLKKDKQIIRKLILKDRTINIPNISNHVKDIAGARIVCSFRSDIEKIVEDIKNDSDFIIIKDKEKDYIKTPKDSGYRGYHILIGVRIPTGEYIPVEIQIRTIAMEMWASLEEKICYHKETSPKLSEDLKRIADNLATFDKKIDYLRNESQKIRKGKIKELVK